MRKTNDEEIIRLLREGKLQKEVAKHFNVSPAAICKRVKRLLPSMPESLAKLTDKEQKFALEIAKGCTQVQAAANSFDVTSLDSAKSIGSELMRKDDIKKAISDLLDEVGLTRRYGAQKMKLHTDHKDPNISLKSIDMMWKLRGEYTIKYEHPVLTYADIQKSIKEIEEEIRKEKIRLGMILDEDEIVEAEFENTEEGKREIANS